MSLRWKAFLVLLTVLAFVHAGLAYNGYANLHEQYERQGLEEFARHRAMLDELFNEAARVGHEQARALAAVASIEDLPWVGELFFGFSSVRFFGEKAELLAEWRLAGLPPNPGGRAREQEIVSNAVRSGASPSVVECSNGCMLRVVTPAFDRAGRKVFVAASYELSATLDQFHRIGGADVLLLADTGAETTGRQLWGRPIAALTNPERLAPMLRELQDEPPLDGGLRTVTAEGHSLLLTLQPVALPSIGEAKAVLVVDQTARLVAIAVHQRNYTTLTLFGLAIATAAIFILLTPSLRRLGQITKGLPLLAEQRFVEARALFARAARRGGFRDEIDRLNTSAMALSNRLQELMGAEAASEAKSQFLAAMSHEIRTPINGLLGLLELHEGTELSDSQRESVRIMRDSALTLLAVVDDILDFSKVEAGMIEVHPVPMALRDAIEGALETLAASAGSKGLRLMCYVQPDLPGQVEADPVRLRQVVLNLCSNAIKFTAQGHVAVAVESPNPRANPVRIRCTVHDTGIGIAPEAHARLFQPFTQAEASISRVHGGTGLGLSICRGLIERMGGTIGFTSVPALGSEFWFELECPVVDATPPVLPSLAGVTARVDVSDRGERDRLHTYLASAGAQVPFLGDGWQLRVADERHTGLRLATPDRSRVLGRPIRYLLLLREAALLCGRTLPHGGDASVAATRPAPKSGRILVAEDHPTNRRVVRQQLERLGYEADIAEDGRRALDLLAQGDYALLLTDLHMPGVDGLSLTRELRSREAAEQRPPLPIIGLTADVLPAAIDRCRAAGMSDVLRKPIALAELGRTLSRWLVTGTATPAIDRSVLVRLMGADDPAMLKETLDDFLRVSVDHMAELFTALVQGDVPTVQRIAHRLSGSARTVGAPGLADAARELERAAAEGRAAALPELHALLCFDYERVRREIAPASPPG